MAAEDVIFVSLVYVWNLFDSRSWLQELLFQICIRTPRNHFQKRKCFPDYIISLVFFSFFPLNWGNIWCYCLIGNFRIKDMYNHYNERSGLKAPLIADDVYDIIMKVQYDFLNWWFFYIQFRWRLLILLPSNESIEVGFFLKRKKKTCFCLDVTCERVLGYVVNRKEIMHVVLDMFGFLGPSLSFNNSWKVTVTILDFYAFVTHVMECTELICCCMKLIGCVVFYILHHKSKRQLA